MNTILFERQLEGYFCTLCYAVFDFKHRSVVLANSGLPYPIRRTGDVASQIELPGFPLGVFAGSSYDEVSFDLKPGDIYVFCSDGIFDARDALGREFGSKRLLKVVQQHAGRSSQQLIDAIFDALETFRGETPPPDDMTAVAIRITA